MPEGSAGPEPTESSADSGERLKPLATRRDFLVGAGAGAVAVGVVGGAAVAVTRGQTHATADCMQSSSDAQSNRAPSIARIGNCSARLWLCQAKSPLTVQG